MKKYLNYVTETVGYEGYTYLNDGDDKCPICGSVDILCNSESDVYASSCRYCKFEWEQYVGHEFNGAEAYRRDSFVDAIKNGEEISEDIEISEQLNPDRTYKSNGEDTCPYCGSKDINFFNSDTNGEEYFDDIDCVKCNNEWRIYKIETFDYSRDVNDNDIVAGELVDQDAYDFNLLIQAKKQKLKNNFNL